MATYQWKALTAAILLSVTFSVSGFNILQFAKCTFVECCGSDYVPSKDYSHALISKFRQNLQTKLYGQHLVLERLPSIVQSHIESSPKKALTIVMQGWTGCGKNYAVDILVDSLYKEGTGSKYYTYFNGIIHFSNSNPEKVYEYKRALQAKIKEKVKECDRSVFVFDEVDKMAPGVLDAIKPYLDHIPSIDGVDYRKAIFIFISNVGGQDITRRYLDLLDQGLLRENMKYQQFEPLLRQALFTEDGAFQDAEIVSKEMVNLYLPFLPLEREHLLKCTYDEIRRQGIWNAKDDVVLNLLNELVYDKRTGKLSTSGCKRIKDKVAVLKAKRVEL